MSFLLLCSVFVYHGYTNANIGPLWVGTWLNIFPKPKQPNRSIIDCSYNRNPMVSEVILLFLNFKSFKWVIYKKCYFCMTVENNACECKNWLNKWHEKENDKFNFKLNALITYSENNSTKYLKNKKIYKNMENQKTIETEPTLKIF